MPVVLDKTFELQVLLVGGSTADVLAKLAPAEPAQASPMTGYVAATIELGQVSGWSTKVRFHAFGRDPWSDGVGLTLEGLGPHLDAIVLVGGGDPLSNDTIERVASRWRERPTHPPVAVLGDDALAAQWAALAEPVTVVAPLDAPSMLKAISPALKIALKGVPRDSTLPPPA
jgi:hypothetical protein